MKQYRIREEKLSNGIKYYYVERRVFLIFWRNIFRNPKFKTLEDAKRYIEIRKKYDNLDDDNTIVKYYTNT